MNGIKTANIFRSCILFISLYLHLNAVAKPCWNIQLSHPPKTQFDSTKHGFRKASFGMNFKQGWNFIGNNLGSIRYRLGKKNSEYLEFPRNHMRDYKNQILLAESSNISSKDNTPQTMMLVKQNRKYYGFVPKFIDSFHHFQSDVWQIGQPWGTFHPQNHNQYYGDSSVFVANGNLVLENIYQPKNFEILNPKKDTISIPMNVGLVNTFHSRNFRYGYFAIRSKNPSGPATWPAFWLTGKNNWPPEIDIFEMYGGKKGKRIHRQTMTLHVGKIETGTKKQIVRHFWLPKNTDTQFHIYACYWTPKRVEYYTDGIKIRSVRFNKWMKQFMQEYMYLVLNNQIEAKYLPELKAQGYPTSKFEIDWIQVYQLDIASHGNSIMKAYKPY